MTKREMVVYRYRIYYKWKGASHSDPIVQEKTAAEIENALRAFPSELQQRLGNTRAEVKSSAVTRGSTEIELLVKTACEVAVLQAALTVTLQDWRLFGEALDAPSAP